MNHNNPIVVFEHATLPIIKPDFEPHHFTSLVKYNELHGNKYFTVGNNRITFKSYVGVIQVGNRVIEVLPKADNVKTSTDGAKTKWQKALLYMLSKAGYIRLNETEKAAQSVSRTNLMDIYLYAFLTEVDELVHAGLVRKYRRIERNTRTLRGRLLVGRQVQHNYIHKELFYVEQTVYDRNNVYNQVLNAALAVIVKISTSGSIRQQAAKQLLYFEEIDAWIGSKTDYDRITTDRKTKPYEQALQLARMIIFNYCPDQRGGGEQVLSLLFNMNVLFERFIYSILKRQEMHFVDKKLKIVRQTGQQFWGGKTIRPDIVIKYYNQAKGDTEKLIVDTKWKIVIAGCPSDEDLKQLYTYNTQFDATHSVLLYPQTDQRNSGAGNFSPGLKEFTFQNSCEMYFINLFAGNDIDPMFGRSFLEYLMNRY